MAKTVKRPSLIRLLFYFGIILPLPFICVKTAMEVFTKHIGTYGDVLASVLIFPISLFLVIKLFRFSFRLVECPAWEETPAPQVDTSKRSLYYDPPFSKDRF